jgi:hypothetical protein
MRVISGRRVRDFFWKPARYGGQRGGKRAMYPRGQPKHAWRKCRKSRAVWHKYKESRTVWHKCRKSCTVRHKCKKSRAVWHKYKESRTVWHKCKKSRSVRHKCKKSCTVWHQCKKSHKKAAQAPPSVSAKSRAGRHEHELSRLLAIFMPNSTILFAGFRLNCAHPTRQRETFLYVWASVLSHGTLLASVLSDASDHVKSEGCGRDFDFLPEV